jgi:DNA topoisomerase-3
MIVVLTEKPSVAREVAALLGASEKKEGFYEGNRYAVTWALGHLIELAKPQDYRPDRLQKDSLPILPDPFILKPRMGIGKDQNHADKSILKQLSVIKRLFKTCDSIIVATDCGREGELIFRYIYEYTECKKPFQRLWVSSLTQKALKVGFANLLPGSDLDNLYLAARARSRADWLVGINASRALSSVAGPSSHSLGRVQTPTLGLICRRYEEYQNFGKVDFWQLQLTHTKSFVEFKSTSVIRWDEARKAKEALKSVSRMPNAEVIALETKDSIEKPPLLFDLTELQKEANSKFGFSASETLDIAQGLYEKQFITYPRTGSKYITQDLWEEVPGLIRGLQYAEGFSGTHTKVKMGRLNKHIVNEGKVTDHHGLLITEKIPSALPVKEAAIYKLIGLRLLEAVSDNCLRETTTVTLQVLHYEFTTRSVAIIEPGWRGIQNDYAGEDSSVDDLPELKKGDQVKLIGAVIQEKQTRPPHPYTEGTLLAAMEQAGNALDDLTLEQAVRGSGLGTPATRADSIEKLLHRGYIERQAKALIPTAKGKAVYAMVMDKDIASVAMTAEWETALEKIEAGSYDSVSFQEDIIEYTKRITKELLNSKVIKEDLPVLPCPKCKDQNLQISESVVRCPDQQCGWLQYRGFCGISLGLDDIQSLIETGRTAIITGMKSKSGKSFNARLVLDADKKVVFSFQ